MDGTEGNLRVCIGRNASIHNIQSRPKAIRPSAICKLCSSAHVGEGSLFYHRSARTCVFVHDAVIARSDTGCGLCGHTLFLLGCDRVLVARCWPSGLYHRSAIDLVQPGMVTR